MWGINKFIMAYMYQINVNGVKETNKKLFTYVSLCQAVWYFVITENIKMIGASLQFLFRVAINKCTALIKSHFYLKQNP